jgi:DMSO/TMAO reductase YedYZ molybdopterin-dependent catalytic subunit
VDLTLLAAVLTLLSTGVASAFAGAPGDGWLFVVHGLAGVVLAGFLALKLWRVRARVRGATRSPTVATSVLLAVLTLSALATGIAWVLGAPLDVPGPFPLLVVHAFLGLVVVVPFLVHLRARFGLPARTTLADRRRAIGYAGVALAGGLAYRAQGAVNDLLDTPGARRRFTGSRERGSDAGNRFPVTAWVADDPDPVDPDDWTLRVGGRVGEPLTLGYDDLAPAAGAAERAVLDCTSGWYSDHEWTGVRVGDLLDRARIEQDAAWVQFRSVTGYRWSLPLPEARDALLAARVDGERLSHGHGFPLRLVAPDRRGFQWVKWVEAVRATRRREAGEWIAIFTSGLGE